MAPPTSGCGHAGDAQNKQLLLMSLLLMCVKPGYQSPCTPLNHVEGELPRWQVSYSHTCGKLISFMSLGAACSPEFVWFIE